MKKTLTLDQLVERMQRGYRTIFGTRDHCLNHLYIVIGNGYDWRKGRLEEIFRDPHKDAAPPDEESYIKWSSREWFNREAKHNPHVESLEYYERLTREMVVECRTSKPSIYPMSHYANALNVPDDVKEDYLMGAVHALALHVNLALTTAPFEHMKNPLTEGQKALSALHALAERFPIIKTLP
jgi:hypothetical protein